MRFLLCFAAVLVSLFALSVSAAPPPGYYLVWGDEFNGNSLDPAKWWVWNQIDRSGYTTPDAVTVSNGYLTITTYTGNGTNYSAIVSSDARFRERFGYTEASVEFNGSPGMFSDFWLQSANNGEFIGNPAASGSEVDICEHRATDTDDATNISDMVTIDLHWDGYGADKESASSGLVGSGLGSGFHTYGLLWNSTNYSFSFDGAPIWNTNAGISDRTEIVLFSCEVDSNSFCGIVPPGGYGSFLTSTTSTVVDYVRFYAPTTTVYWIGAGSADWTNGGNWLSNMIPTSAGDVVFSYLTVGNTATALDQDTTVNSLSIEETPPLSISGNTLTVNSGGIDMLSALNNATINSPLVLGAAQAWTIGSGLALTVNTVGGAGNLTLNGLGTVVMVGTNHCSGFTTVSSGVLLVNGVITNAITVTGGTLGGTGNMTGPVTVNSGTLTGTGTLTAPVVINNGGILSPGSTSGTLTISNTLALQPGSTTLIYANKSAGASGNISGMTGISYGGTLVFSNQSGTLAAGDSFNLFNAAGYSGGFTRITPTTPGNGLAWNTNTLITDGTLRVIATNNAALTAQWVAGQVSVSWPAMNIGWLLQSQTNPLGVGLTANWTTLPASIATNNMTFPVNPTAGSVFFRLASPLYSTAVFARGDLIVLEVGNGAINTNGAPGSLYDFSPLGGSSPVHIALPTTGTNALVFGASSYDGALSLSADGRKIVIAGYNIAAGAASAAVDSSSATGSAAVLRAVGSMDGIGNFTLNATTAKFSDSTIRCAASDGSGNFWAGGGSSGIVYLGSNSPAATLSSVSTATRDLAMVNGSIYFTETGSGQGVMAFTGAPTSTATPTLILSMAGTGTGTPSPKGFAFNTALTIAYVADNRTASSGGGVQRFNWNGGAWVYAYTLGDTLTSSQTVEDMVVDFSGPNPVIYAITGETTGNHLVVVTDTGAGSAYAKLAGAASGNAFRGLTFAPTSP